MSSPHCCTPPPPPLRLLPPYHSKVSWTELQSFNYILLRVFDRKRSLIKLFFYPRNFFNILYLSFLFHAKVKVWNLKRLFSAFLIQQKAAGFYSLWSRCEQSHRGFLTIDVLHQCWLMLLLQLWLNLQSLFGKAWLRHRLVFFRALCCHHRLQHLYYVTSSLVAKAGATYEVAIVSLFQIGCY